MVPFHCSCPFGTSPDLGSVLHSSLTLGLVPILTIVLSVQLKFRSLKLTTNAALQRQFRSPFIFREEDPSRQVSCFSS